MDYRIAKYKPINPSLSDGVWWNVKKFVKAFEVSHETLGRKSSPIWSIGSLMLD